MTKDIVFFGTEDFSLGALKALVESGFPIALVVTKPDSPRGRGHHMVAPAVKTYAISQDIPVIQPAKISDIHTTITTLHEPAGVLVSFGKIIPQSIIDLFSPGIINVHPSLLPKYRGPSPIEAAILNGDSKTGVSIMQLSAKMDAGPVYGYTPYALNGTETSIELYETLGDIGSQTLVKLLPLILNGEATGLPQAEEEATYCKLINKSDGIINWHKPAEQIEREIRAYTGWPQSRTKFGTIEVIITKAHAVPHSLEDKPGHREIIDEDGAGILMISTGDGCLCIDSLKPLGKKEMPVQAFLAGYRSKLSS